MFMAAWSGIVYRVPFGAANPDGCIIRNEHDGAQKAVNWFEVCIGDVSKMTEKSQWGVVQVAVLCILETVLCATRSLKEHLYRRRGGQENLFSTSYGRI